ncbi:MAG: hypothetical protein HY909_21420 [Deltaproteobacteria bacterium]|nr:hypothetical protein [Deltaproteobacteria bacterium]
MTAVGDRWRFALVALGLLGCPRRGAPAGDAGATARDAPAAARDAPRVTVGSGAEGPWRTDGIVSAAVSPAVSTAEGVFSAVALPREDLSRAELRWVRWSASGAEVLARTEVTGMVPGSALALVPREGGFTVLWPPGRGEARGDAGGALRAQDATPAGFTGPEREASAELSQAGQWIAQVMARRAREGVLELAPAVSRGGLGPQVALRGRVGVVTLDGVEVTRGEDLLGYERAVGAGQGAGGVRWVAVSRGACADARVELFEVRGRAVTSRASFAIGKELGIRWVTVEATSSVVVVTWYQDWIPLRLACVRGPQAPRADEHGLRVAVVRL